MFPNELMEIILSYLDVEDLTRFKIVNRTWYSLIEKIIGYEDWRKKCLEKIPNSSLSSLHAEVTGYQSEDHRGFPIEPSEWFEIYKTWKKWQISALKELSDESVDIAILPSGRFDFSCIATYHDVLAVGTEDGFIRFYLLPNLMEPYFIADNMQSVKKISFWLTGDGLQAVSQCRNNSIKFWDLEHKEEVESRRDVSPIILGSENWLYKAAKYGNLYNVTIQHGLDLTHSSKIIDVEIPIVGGIEMMHVERDIIYILAINEDTSGLCITLKDENEMNYKSEWHTIAPLPDCMDHLLVRGIYVYNRVAFAISCDIFCISVTGRPWKAYTKVFSQLSGNIKCVVLHSNILLLGLDIGELHIFRLENLNELETLDLNSPKKMVHLLDQQPIQSISVTMYDDVRYIIAMTRRKVFVIGLE